MVGIKKITHLIKIADYFLNVKLNNPLTRLSVSITLNGKNIYLPTFIPRFKISMLYTPACVNIFKQKYR